MSLFKFASIAFFLVGVPAFAGTPRVVCGGQAGSSAVELDYLTTMRGGNDQNQVVLRDSRIIQYFISQRAIYGNELNQKGEFVVIGYGDSNWRLKSNSRNYRNSVAAEVSNRHVYFEPNSDGSFTLSVSYTDEHNHSVQLADFTFHDCTAAE